MMGDSSQMQKENMKKFTVKQIYKNHAKMKKMTKAEIRGFNSKVNYNHSVAGWIFDIITCIIAFPMIVLVAYRRGKYNHKISETE